LSLKLKAKDLLKIVSRKTTCYEMRKLLKADKCKACNMFGQDCLDIIDAWIDDLE